MYRVPIADVQPGSVLGACIFTDSGRPLLQSCVALTSSTVIQIASRGYTLLTIWITVKSRSPSRWRRMSVQT